MFPRVPDAKNLDSRPFDLVSQLIRENQEAANLSGCKFFQAFADSGLPEQYLGSSNQRMDQPSGGARVVDGPEIMEPGKVSKGPSGPDKPHYLLRFGRLYQIGRPSFDGFVIDNTAGIDVSQAFQRDLTTLLFLLYPGTQGLLNHPTARSLQTGGDFIDPIGKGERDVGGNYFRVHGFGI